MKIGVPSGIGDISWIISKVVNSDEWKKGELEIVISDGWPFRAQPYLDMLSIKSEYGNFRFEDIIAFEKTNPYKRWSDVISRQAGLYLLQPNWHLEAGRPLAQYLPDLSTNYHYELKIPALSSNFQTRGEIQRLSKGDWIGISCASYRGAHAWRTWDLLQWKALSELLISEGFSLCLLGGKWDDLTDSLSYEIPEDSCLNLVGKTEFSEACAIHEMLSGYIGFSSGLGIIRTVMSLPTLMLWPSNDHINQQPLSTSWADPRDLDSGRYIAKGYIEPYIIAKVFLKQIRNNSLVTSKEEGGR